MQIVLSPEVEALVQRQLTTGKYKSAIEVILAAIQLLEQQEDIYQGTTARTSTRRSDWPASIPTW
ncbi:ribbon-helix-helix domain-containing protein [Microcoleus vaginatus]|uniref:ribbon-helix-helix domain-containing protein n=1 Tax=Microcoleus vaginatus TaxID=119532 RepID=UPI00403F363D